MGDNNRSSVPLEGRNNQGSSHDDLRIVAEIEIGSWVVTWGTSRGEMVAFLVNLGALCLHAKSFLHEVTGPSANQMSTSFIARFNRPFHLFYFQIPALLHRSPCLNRVPVLQFSV
jgi:hypothetical protein